jgi:hypothetical protein
VRQRHGHHGQRWAPVVRVVRGADRDGHCGRARVGLRWRFRGRSGGSESRVCGDVRRVVRALLLRTLHHAAAAVAVTMCGCWCGCWLQKGGLMCSCVGALRGAALCGANVICWCTAERLPRLTPAIPATCVLPE